MTDDIRPAYLADRLHDFYRINLQYRQKLYEERTPFQHIEIFDTDYFGRVLLLDGVIQLTEFDNHAYHEMITHIPMLAHPAPSQIMIIGGGDGGTLQQVLRYSSVKTVTVVELDERVVEVCNAYFPGFGQPFADPRVELVIEDAFDNLKKNRNKFDVIIADTTDPIGEAEDLFSREFYESMWLALKQGGVIVTQCEQMYFDRELIRKMMGFARDLAISPAYYHALVPTYPGGGIGFLYVADFPWRNGLGKPYPGDMQYLNPEVHQAAFALPNFLLKNL